VAPRDPKVDVDRKFSSPPAPVVEALAELVALARWVLSSDSAGG
jgi:hypothetical protein